MMTDNELISHTAAQPDSLEKALLERVETGILELPLLPKVAWKVMELSRANNTDARQLSEVIHKDPTLASYVLRVANSPAYMPRMPITSLQQAISRLGLRQLGEIVFAASLQSRLFEAPGYEQEIQTLWQHSVGTAVYASEIAHLLSRSVEGAFLCGLLHDIGKAVIIQLLIDLQNQEASMLVPTALDSLVETHHNYVGSLLAKEWGLPAHVYEVILSHHDDPLPPACPDLVSMTQVADCLSYHMMAPELVDINNLINHDVLTALSLDPDKVATLLGQADKVQRTVDAMT